MAFPPGFLDELRARLSLSDIVGRKVSLKRRSGAEYAGLCPFHNEKTPSFTVNDKKGFFYCFGCHEKGSAIDFVMKTEGLSFPETVEKLAREVNLPVPVATPAERERADRAATLQQVVEMAAVWFQKQLRLPVGRQGLDYLRGRGLSDATIDDFRLGFAPDSRDGLIAALKRENVPIEKIVEAGLAIQPEDRREPYDRFRGRVMFVINDRRGRAIAFGGRVMGAGEPKYLNSPETPLFHKGANLYCLDRARQAATKDQPVIVAEGYMDVIALQGAGFTGAVAPLGTALTEGQLGELWKLADEPYLCFDGDNAGRKAAARALEASLEQVADNKTVAFLFLPPEDDPDSYIRTHGAEAFRKLARQAMPLTDFLMQELKAGKDLASAEGRSQLVHAAKPLLGRLQAPLLRLQLAKLLAQASGFSQSEIESLCELPAVVRKTAPARTPRGAPSPIARKLLRLIVQQPGLAARLTADLIPDGQAETDALEALVSAVAEGGLSGEGFGMVLEHFRGTTHEGLISEVLTELIEQEFDEESIEAVFADTVERLRQAVVRSEIEALNAKHKSVGLAPEEVRRLQQLLAQKQPVKPATTA